VHWRDSILPQVNLLVQMKLVEVAGFLEAIPIE